MISHFLTLAETGGGFDGLTVTVGAVAALGTAVAAVIRAHKAGEEKGKATRTKIEPSPLPVEVSAELATKDELREVEQRLTVEIRKLENHQNGERTIARNANSNIHARLDKMAEKSDLLRIHERIDAQSLATATAAASLAEVKSNVGKLLDIALAKTKPSPRV
jgi:3-keto-L-gulonate-6-phosphate decarboxylase